MNTAAAPVAAKTQQQIDRNNSKRWDWETALRLLNAQTHYPPGCDHYNAFVDTIWKDARINCERSTCWSQKTHLAYQLEEPTSSRIVTSKQHSKHTGMRPIVLSIHSLNIPNHLTVPSVHCPESFQKASSREPHKKPREQYLGSLKDPLNETKEDRWIFHYPPPDS